LKIIRIIARLNVGGPAKHVVWLTQGLQGAECETLLVAGRVPEGEDDMSYFAAEQNVSPLFVPSMSREISLKDALTVWKLYRLFVRQRPDIVHTHTAKAGTVGRFAGFLYRWLTPATLLGRPRVCRFVHTYHGHIFHSYYGALKTKIFLTVEKLLAWLVTDRIVVISEQQRHEIHEQFRVGRSSQFAVIPLGLDTHVFADWETKRHRFRAELQAPADEILIGIVGRLTEIKNHDLFLRMAARYKAKNGSGKDFRQVRFVVIGDGHLRATLEQQAQALGLAEDVVFTGSRQDPEYFYPALDIVALTSRNEGTPLTLIEAMLNARPVISTAVGGVVDLLGEIVDPETAAQPYAVCQRGISVPPDSDTGLAEGLARLIADVELSRMLGKRAAEFVARNYSKDRLLEDVSRLYQEVLQPAVVAVNNGRVNRSLASRL
jgi:glycosyltransferase involved in cell wall biosynthesis